MVIPTEVPSSNPISQTDAEVQGNLLRHYEEKFAERREHELLRSEESSRVRGWFRGNTKIGPVLDVNVCYHQGRYGVEIMIESLFLKEQFLGFTSWTESSKTWPQRQKKSLL